MLLDAGAANLAGIVVVDCWGFLGLGGTGGTRGNSIVVDIDVSVVWEAQRHQDGVNHGLLSSHEAQGVHT